MSIEFQGVVDIKFRAEAPEFRRERSSSIGCSLHKEIFLTENEMGFGNKKGSPRKPSRAQNDQRYKEKQRNFMDLTPSQDEPSEAEGKPGF